MKYALSLSDRGKGKAFPNPTVGAVIVKEGIVVGTGATDVCGGLHAEKVALKEAGEKAREATLYVTLEPCCHYGKTPPCTHEIVKAGIQKVVIAVKDPNPLVNGKGVRYLRRKNISVSVGLMRKEASEQNEDFFWAIKHKVPWISLKLAITLDGKIADINGDSKWITSEKSRKFVHDIRRRHAAIAIGSKTLERDNPQLNVRYVKGKSPVRIVFSSRRNQFINSWFRKDARKNRSIIVCNSGKKGQKSIAPDGVEIWYTGFKKSPGNLNAFMKMAYNDELISVLIEGGQKLASSFLEYKLVNRLYLFYGNKLLGKGIDGFSFSKELVLKNGIFLTNVKVFSFDDNFMITGIPKWES